MWLLTSPSVFPEDSAARAELIAALQSISQFADVGVVSNHSEPDWFAAEVDGAKVNFLRVAGRQQGTWLREAAAENGVSAHQVIVLAGSLDDIQMSTNNSALLVGAGWVDDEGVTERGLKVPHPNELEGLVKLYADWDGRSWYRAQGPSYTVEALCDVSTLRKGLEQERFGGLVTDAVKHATPRLNGLLAVAAGTLVRSGVIHEGDLLWGAYPSSKSTNEEEEAMCDFTHRLRTSLSRVWFAKREVPLFWRHQPAPKRSAGEGGDREDPTSEVESLHLNPYYRKGKRLRGRNVILLDDCTTYGVSMGVAAGFLRKAGALSVTCLAVGKFGRRLGCYDVKVNSSPFRPVEAGNWSVEHRTWTEESESGTDQATLRRLLLG